MVTSLPQEQWHTLLRDAHPGYISWEQYQDNQRQLRQNERKCGTPTIAVQLAQGRPCCRDWRCVAFAATPCAWPTTLRADNSSPTTNATAAHNSAANRHAR